MIRSAQPPQMVGALVLAKFTRRQPVIRGPRIRVLQQRGQRIIPLALRARPALKRMTRCPDHFPRRLGFQFALIGTALIHHSTTPAPEAAWPPIRFREILLPHPRFGPYRARFAARGV